MNGIYLILGSNLGDKFLAIQYAIRHIRQKIGPVEAESSYYDTQPWGYRHQANYLNKAIKVQTLMSPGELLEQLMAIEREFGRVRKEKWRERTLDIDILYYFDVAIKQDNLVIPHPEIPNRLFVLVPMCEIAPEELHPISGKSQKQMLDECPDTLGVVKLADKKFSD